MKNLLPKILTTLLSLSLTPLFGQEYPRGAILDPALYQQTEAAPVLLTRNLIPRAFSLKNYAPFPESQGNYGTCTGWAAAFAARTISESIVLGRTNREQSSNATFSPIYVYKNISNDPNGASGTVIPHALALMKNSGAVKRLPAEKTMAFKDISISMYNGQRRFPIAGWTRLFDNPWGRPGTISERVVPVKQNLAKRKPVIIGMNTPKSFNSAKDIWRPAESESPNNKYGGHAMCVVGYDDDYHGGAFEIQNSWGTNYGKGGYIWISYGDFAAFVAEAYVIAENLLLYNDAARYAASIEIEVFEQKGGMPVSLENDSFYKTREDYAAGTTFRFLMTNRHRAYVHAFSADNKKPGTVRIHPLPGTTGAMDYGTATSIAWPGEKEWMRLDDVSGTDYLVVLFSKEKLDIDAIERRFAKEAGNFSERVARAVGPDFIPYSQVKYDRNKIDFSANSNNPKAVFGLLLAIGHK